MICARCFEEKDSASYSVGEPPVGDEGQLILLCDECRKSWQMAPEHRRLRAISQSVFAEWIERERCEALVEKVKQANAASEAAATPLPPEKEKGK